ncbi:MAG TPA: hypothetical protein DE060_05230 [Lentisphaeria bacterium]|nr:hypothetical protein [Lentisphaeria bacterium]HCG48597.1 hypothetical protein [Lentisphaeria bacterium]
MKKCRKTIVLPAVLGGMMLALCACQDSVNTLENTDKTAQREYVNSQYFSTDSYCRDRITILAINKATTDSGLMKLQVQIRSNRYGFWSELWSDIMGANPYHISYKVDWLDAKGMKVNTASSVWLPEILMPGEVKYIQSVAPNANCKDFFISFKEN